MTQKTTQYSLNMYLILLNIITDVQTLVLNMKFGRPKKIYNQNKNAYEVKIKFKFNFKFVASKIC